jgi:TRAP-type C4-dicarboxylate transport system substrate-binding protein
MRSKLLTFGAVAAFAVGLASQAWAADVTWRLGSSVGPQDPTTLALEELAKRVAEKSNGRFEIEVVPIETIGFKNVDTLRVLKQGVLDAMHVVPYYVPRDEPLLANMMPHGALLEPEDNLKIVDVQYEIGWEILSEKWGFVPVARAPFGALRDLVIVSKEPVNTLEGLRDIKFRHFTKDGLQAFNKLGVSTQVVPSSELYLALKTGVVDGSVYGPTYIKSQSIYEVTCCYSYLGAFTMAFPFTLTATQEGWNKVPADLQKIVADESNTMWNESVEQWREGAAEAEAEAFLIDEGGMKKLDPVPLEDRKKIQAALLSVWKENAEQIGPEAVENYNRIVAALNKGS